MAVASPHDAALLAAGVAAHVAGGRAASPQPRHILHLEQTLQYGDTEDNKAGRDPPRWEWPHDMPSTGLTVVMCVQAPVDTVYTVWARRGVGERRWCRIKLQAGDILLSRGSPGVEVAPR